MPVSSAGHLPHITSTSYPALVSYLTSTYHAQKVANWSVSIRIFRSSFENSKDTSSRPKVMYVVSLSEFPTETFILIEDGEIDTRASVRGRIQDQKQQDLFLNGNTNGNENDQDTTNTTTTTMVPPNYNIAQLEMSLQKTSTRYTLFTSSIHYTLLLSRLNLPPALGAPSMGDGVNSNNQTTAGPGAWLPRGGTIVIEGATYELPSAARYGVEEAAYGGNCEWKVRLGMLQSGASRSSGAIIENEYLPLLRLSDPMLLLSHLHGLFPSYLTNPTPEGQGQAINSGTSIHYPSPEQWDEVIPASNQGWVENLNKGSVGDSCGWKGKERGRRLAYLYITLLRAQGLL